VSLAILDRARRYLAKLPPAVSGQGGHNATFRAASVLVQGFALNEADAMALLHEFNEGCQPPWSECELLHKVRSAMGARQRERRGYLLKGDGERMEGGGWKMESGRGRQQDDHRRDACATLAGGTHCPTTAGGTHCPTAAGGTHCPTTAGETRCPTMAGGTRCPTTAGETHCATMAGGTHGSTMPGRKARFERMVLERIAAQAGGIPDPVGFLRERSPVAVDGLDSVGVLRWLYPRGSGEKVLLFSEMRSQGQMAWSADWASATRNEDLPAGPEGVWFLPQPVDGQYHSNPRLGGKPSRRSEESVTAWRYVVLESDQADPDLWLRALVQMPLGIACICESGGRSIHALVRLDEVSKAAWDEQVRAMKPVLVTLGADPGALSAVRLTRLPQARRGNRRQRLLFLDPNPSGKAIWRPGEPTKGRR
jgi:hypothetical protein